MKALLYTLAILLSVSSCKSIDKMVEKGDYENAYFYAIKKLAGEKNKKTKYVVGLEKAYAELNKRDLQTIESYNNSGRLDKYESMHDIYTRMEKRQNALSGLVPLTSKDGYVASFEMDNYTSKKSVMIANSLNAYYSKANELLSKSELENSKIYAREAYDYFNKMSRFDRNYKDTPYLMDKAKSLGTVHVAVDFKKEDGTIFHKVAIEKIHTIRLDRLNTLWESYYFFDSKKVYDKYVVINVDNVEFGHEKENVNNYEMSALVEDGIEYVYDEKGKVRVDSLGHKITVPRKVITKAWVSEIMRNKESRASAKVMLYDEVRSLPVQTLPVVVHHNFYDSAVRFTGDRRALNTDLCGRLDDYIASFPSNYETADFLALNITSAIEDAIRKLRIS